MNAVDVSSMTSSSSAAAAVASTASLRRSISTPTALFFQRALTTANNHDNDDSTSTTSSSPNNSLLFHQSGKHNTTLAAASSLSLNRLLNKFSPEQFAKQITLIDWKIFRKITRHELKPGQWTGSMKHHLSPNVVLFTRRFNIMTFWVSEEILSLKTPKQRAERISFFIKLTTNLIEIRNLHSSYAIKSALTSASIHRLEKTWNQLSKKDRHCLEKINVLFSEANNSTKLRSFMEHAIKQQKNANCIPNLATYLRDIIHIDSAYPQNESRFESYRHEKLESIYGFIEKCQKSNYGDIEEIPDIYEYLVSRSYMEELQKFLEDNFYKKSLKLEPEPNPEAKKKLSYHRFSSHYDIRSLQMNDSYQNQSSIDLDRINDYSDLLNKSFNVDVFRSKETADSNFHPGHRKTSSYETNMLLSSMNSQRNNTSAAGKLRSIKVNLIDDTPICDVNTYQVPKRDKRPTLEMFKKKSDGVSFDSFCHNLDDLNDQTFEKSYTEDIIHKGCVKRKTVLKDKKKPSWTSWTTYHLQLTTNSLLFINPKSNVQVLRQCKVFSLLEWSAFAEVNPPTDTFTLADHSCSTVYKIQTSDEMSAKEWVRLIKEATSNLRQFFI